MDGASSSIAVDSAQPPQSRIRVPAEPGFWVLVFGDLVVFTILFVAYLQARRENPSLFAMSQEALSRSIGAANTLILLTSSLVIVYAIGSYRDERVHRLSGRLIATGAAIGSGFVVLKVLEYRAEVAAGFTPNTNEFFLYYYILTGLHLTHVVIGLAGLILLRVLTRRPLRTNNLAWLEAGACFWHLVDMLWIAIFTIVYLVR